MNVGQLFREFNEYRHLFDGDKTIDENLDIYVREKLRDFLKIIPNENIVVEKLKVFVGQQYKKISNQTKDSTEEIKKDLQEKKIIPQENSNKIYLRDGVYLSKNGKNMVLEFPDYKIIY